VRAIERAAHVDQYAVINIGHPDVTPMEDLAEKIRRELGAAPDLVEVRDLPPRMTLVKRPTLERQRTLLGVTPAVGLDEGIARVCRGVRERLRASGDSQSVG
jgi:nucleoside-diphosphate-sugar epimerase